MLSSGPTGHQVPDKNVGVVAVVAAAYQAPTAHPAIKSRMHRETAKHGPSRSISSYSSRAVTYPG